MVQRIYCKCSLCGKVTMIKYQAGHSSFPIIFTCPSCLSEIRGYCKNDDERVELHINFENAETINEIVTPDYFLTASRELLTAHIKKYEENDEFSPSPFIILSDVLYGLSDNSNWKRAIHFTELDAPTYNKIFDYVQLWEHGQESLLADKLRPILPSNLFPLNNRLEIYRGLRSYYVQFIMELVPSNWMKNKKTFAKMSEVYSKNQNQVNLFIQNCEENGEFKRIETKLYSLMKSFVNLIEGILPAFLILDCPIMEDELDHFGISTVSFGYLLDFYQKSYEVIVDATDILIALNNILYRNDYEILPGNQGKTFSERRIESNKIKKLQDCLLSDECFSELLEELPRNRIRNSVGHYATEFNGVTQQITFIDEHQGKRREECLPLVQFAVLCINNFHTIFYFSEVVYQLRNWYFILKGDIPFRPKSIKYSRAQKQKKRIGRNDPCPCESGKKYKKCCLNKEP